MRITLTALLIMIVAFSCNTPVKQVTVGPIVDTAYNYDTLQGSYVGDFGGSDIRIVLTHVTGVHAIGYNLHKGLRRNMYGRMQKTGNTYTFQLNEPGDHQFDGKFIFTIDAATFMLHGNWTPLNDKSLTQKTFTLKKIVDTGLFEYNILLTWADSIGELTISKNGACVYEYYPVVNGKPAEQLIRVKGTWSGSDSVYNVDWEQNTVFPSRKSTFTHKTLRVDSLDYSYEVLTGDGRTFTMNEF